MCHIVQHTTGSQVKCIVWRLPCTELSIHLPHECETGTDYFRRSWHWLYGQEESIVIPTVYTYKTCTYIQCMTPSHIWYPFSSIHEHACTRILAHVGNMPRLSILKILTVSVCVPVLDVMHFPSVALSVRVFWALQWRCQPFRVNFRIKWILMSSYLEGCGILCTDFWRG